MTLVVAICCILLFGIALIARESVHALIDADVTADIPLDWPMILLVVKAPDRLKSSNEREAERMVRKINLDRLIKENEQRIMELKSGAQND